MLDCRVVPNSLHVGIVGGYLGTNGIYGEVEMFPVQGYC